MRVRGPTNIGRAVQTDPTLLDHGTTGEEMLGVAGSKVWPVSNFAQQLPTRRNNMQQGVQTDPTLLRYASAITEQKKCWELLAEKFDRFQTLRNNTQQRHNMQQSV